MELLKLFWDLDANNGAKFIIFIMVAVCILCIICRPKNKKDMYKDSSEPTNCQIDYKLCKENSKRGNNAVCHVCKPNGEYPDKIYSPDLGWIGVDPKTGKSVD